jgi:site-specific DNA-methyltransferase (adenine-specific)
MAACILEGDCRAVMPAHGPYDMILADPPYGDTSLTWDRIVAGWEAVALSCLKPSGSLWVFGSLRYFMTTGAPAGFRLAQDVVWEKHNGSGLHADRFKRVHELAVHFYRADAAWAGVWNDVQKTNDASARLLVRSKRKPPHLGATRTQTVYRSLDGGPRIRRSVIPMRSMHGRAIHPTEKPADLIEILIRTSCPPGGLVGDFFAGSGAGGVAAVNAGRRYIGCEVDPGMAQKAIQRLSAHAHAAPHAVRREGAA